MHKRRKKPIRRAKPTNDPITMPAIAPPDSPFFIVVPASVAESDGVGLLVGVVVGKSGGRDTTGGSRTFLHWDVLDL